MLLMNFADGSPSVGIGLWRQPAEKPGDNPRPVWCTTHANRNTTHVDIKSCANSDLQTRLTRCESPGNDSPTIFRSCGVSFTAAGDRKSEDSEVAPNGFFLTRTRIRFALQTSLKRNS